MKITIAPEFGIHVEREQTCSHEFNSFKMDKLK